MIPHNQLRIGIIGQNFMGRAHSNAWLQAARFFDLPLSPTLKVCCGRNTTALRRFAQNWGWEDTESDWRRVVERDDVDLIDICTPQSLHCDIAVAAAENGKHVMCEKPLAISSTEASAMLDAVQRNGVRHFLSHNYRRVPAVLLAKQLLDERRLGRVFHWRGSYQQDWIVDPDFPLTWQLQSELAGYGPHGDLNSHSVDLAQFLVSPIASVSCLTAQFISDRPLPSDQSATFATGNQEGKVERGKVTVEDASLMHACFENGAVGSFEATRFASGRKNRNTFEIYGDQGSLTFDLERINELNYFSADDPEHVQGFRTILATENGHPYIQNWWPPGHTIGYEHTFVHGVVDFVRAIHTGEAVAPDFRDGCRVLDVLEAGAESSRSQSKMITVQNRTVPDS